MNRIYIKLTNSNKNKKNFLWVVIPPTQPPFPFLPPRLLCIFNSVGGNNIYVYFFFRKKKIIIEKKIIHWVFSPWFFIFYILESGSIRDRREKVFILLEFPSISPLYIKFYIEWWRLNDYFRWLIFYQHSNPKLQWTTENPTDVTSI